MDSRATKTLTVVLMRGSLSISPIVMLDSVPNIWTPAQLIVLQGYACLSFFDHGFKKSSTGSLALEPGNLGDQGDSPLEL